MRSFQNQCRHKEYSAILITGERQAGKSTLFETIMKEIHSEREIVTLDGLEERALARKDPGMFLQIHEPPIMIDEIQYAPELFSYIKIAIDHKYAWVKKIFASKSIERSVSLTTTNNAVFSLPIPGISIPAGPVRSI